MAAPTPKIISCEVYPFDIMVYFGASTKPIFKELKKYMDEAQLAEAQDTFSFNDSMTSARTAMHTNGTLILWMNGRPTTPHQYGVLAHEIFHAVCFIMDRVGVKYTIMESDEAFAYLIGFITKRIYEEYKL